MGDYPRPGQRFKPNPYITREMLHDPLPRLIFKPLTCRDPLPLFSISLLLGKAVNSNASEAESSDAHLAKWRFKAEAYID